MPKGKVHVLMQVWQGSNPNGKMVTYHEMELLDVFCDPELILDLSGNRRTTQDWLEEVAEETDFSLFIHPSLEICAEPILYEAIGILEVEDYHDYWGNYDEEVSFEILNWSCASIDEEDEAVL